jgi:hypothetical protein
VITAVAPTITPTAVIPSTPTPTAAPKPIPTDETVLIESGVTYWDESGRAYGRYEPWQCLKRVNGWHERNLPIGELMRLPDSCK